MPDQRFQSLSKLLLECGVDPRFATRLGAELQDHFADLEQEALADERSPDEAEAEASQRLGDEAVIASELLRRPELRRWLYRSEWLLHCLAFVVALLEALAAPFYALVAGRNVLLRYGAAVAAACAVTLALLFVMQLAIHQAPDRASDQTRMRASFTQASTSVIIEEWESVPDRPGRPSSERPAQQRDDYPLVADVARHLNLTPRADELVPAGLVDGDLLPLVKEIPAYPALAASQGLEGYVVVEFTVTPAGTVRDVVVIESTSELFNEAAVEATHKFKYKPRVVSGRPVEVSGVRNKITFALEA